MTAEQVKFFLEWAVMRAQVALLDNGIIPHEPIVKSLEHQIMSLMTQVEFRMGVK